jgi:hypothetical protein
LPSQQGFGTDLSASDTIIPIIDLTAAAEGSDVPELLQTALSFGSQTAISLRNANGTIANSPGFYRFIALASVDQNGPSADVELQLNDGATTKVIWRMRAYSTGGIAATIIEPVDIVVFLGTGESFNADASGTNSFLEGSVRQLADANGTLLQPAGFTPQ